MNLIYLLNLVLFSFFINDVKNTYGLLEKFHDDVVRRIASDSSLLNVAKQTLDFDNDSINNDCLEDLQDIISLKERWVWRMIDSSGGIPHGILKYNFNSIGQYRECIETSFMRTSGREITGRHCMLNIPIIIQTPPDVWEQKLNYYLNISSMNLERKHKEMRNKIISRDGESVRLDFNIGICLPSACSVKAINQMLSAVVGNSSDISISEHTCTTDKKSIKLSPGDIATICFLSVIGLIMLCSTLYDLWYQLYKKGDKRDQRQLYIAFSVYTNSQRLFTPSKNPGPLACLHGIRVITLFWIILGHRYSYTLQSAIENLADMVEWVTDPSSSILLGGLVSVDTFFLMSGILLSYVFFRSAKTENIARDLPIFYVHRILRLTPLLAVVILLHATLLSHYGNGPYKFIIDFVVVESCVKEWWATLLYVQNYVGEYICVGQSWYLAVDMQLFLISPLLLYPLLWKKKIGILWISVLIAAAQSLATSIVFSNQWFAGILHPQESADMMLDFYIPTHTRATPYLIGILAGYLLFHSLKKNNITTIQYKFLQETHLKQFIILLCWACSLTILGAVLFGVYPLNQPGHTFSKWQDSLFLAFNKTAWSVGLLCVIVACAYGYGGPINWFLSLTMWEILGRFTYALYLTHMTIQLLLVYTTNHIRVFSHINTVYDFFGDLVSSFAVSYIFILAFESPIGVLEKLIFKRENTKRQSEITKEEGIKHSGGQDLNVTLKV